MRLIDADALMDRAKKTDGIVVYDHEKHVLVVYAEEFVRDLLTEMPTIDSVKHGKWTKHILKNANVPWGYDCSACDGWFVVGEDVIKKYHFCPNCGVMMNQGGDGDE